MLSSLHLSSLVVIAAILTQTAKTSISQIFDQKLLTRLTDIEEELSVLKTKQLTKHRVKEFKVFSKEVRIFENQANTIYQGQTPEKWLHFTLLQGYNAKQKYIDKYNNLFFFFGGKKKIKILDLSGGVVLDAELDYQVKFYYLVQDSVRQMPKIFVLTEDDQLQWYQVAVKRVKARRRAKVELKLRTSFEIFSGNPISGFPMSFQLSARKFTHFKVKLFKQGVLYLLADSVGNIYKLDQNGMIRATLTITTPNTPINDIFVTYPLFAITTDHEISYFSMSLQNKTAICQNFDSRILAAIHVPVRKYVVAFVTDDNKVKFVTQGSQNRQRSVCQKLSQVELDPLLEIRDPKLVLIGQYLLLFPRAGESDFLVFDASVMVRPSRKKTSISGSLHLENFSHSKESVLISKRAKSDKFYLFDFDPKSGIFNAREVNFPKDKIGEVSSFRMPLMFIGIGVAFVYQVCFNAGKTRKGRRRGGKGSTRQTRKDKLKMINDKVRRLEDMTNSFRGM